MSRNYVCVKEDLLVLLPFPYYRQVLILLFSHRHFRAVFHSNASEQKSIRSTFKIEMEETCSNVMQYTGTIGRAMGEIWRGKVQDNISFLGWLTILDEPFCSSGQGSRWHLLGQNCADF